MYVLGLEINPARVRGSSLDARQDAGFYLGKVQLELELEGAANMSKLQIRLSDLVRGRINLFSLDVLMELEMIAGL